MNERIQELYRQANEQARQQACEKSKTLRPQNNTVWNEFVPLFAELIVRECVKSTIALQNTAIDNEWHLDETFHIIVDDMVEQFDMQYIFRSEE